VIILYKYLILKSIFNISNFYEKRHESNLALTIAAFLRGEVENCKAGPPVSVDDSMNISPPLVSTPYPHQHPRST